MIVFVLLDMKICIYYKVHIKIPIRKQFSLKKIYMPAKTEARSPVWNLRSSLNIPLKYSDLDKHFFLGIYFFLEQILFQIGRKLLGTLRIFYFMKMALVLIVLCFYIK